MNPRVGITVVRTDVTRLASDQNVQLVHSSMTVETAPPPHTRLPSNLPAPRRRDQDARRIVRAAAGTLWSSAFDRHASAGFRRPRTHRHRFGNPHRMNEVAPMWLPAGWTVMRPSTQAIILGLLTLVQEDVPTVGAAVLPAAGHLPWLTGWTGIFLGIWLGDALLYLFARGLGRPLLQCEWTRRLFNPAAVARSEQWFSQHGSWLLLGSLFVPGTRLPTYLAAGFLRLPFTRFLLATGTAVAVWTTGIFLLARIGARLWTEALEQRIDEISQRLHGFFIGRYDIRYESETALRSGQAFQIIELNGAASEATSIYDSRNSLGAAYRTLFRQWELVFAIGAANRQRGTIPTLPGELWQAWRATNARIATYPPAD